MAYSTTLTLPTISGTHSNFPVLIKTSDLPSASYDGANAFASDGGNFVAYTDDTKTTRLPVEVHSFGNGASPTILVFVGTTSASSSATIYVEADDVQTVQPAANSTYGSQNVWLNAGYEFVSHDLIKDSTGNYSGTFTTNGNPTLITDPFGKGLSAYEFDGSGDRINVPVAGRNPMSGTSTGDYINVEAWMYSTSTNSNNRGVHIVGASSGNVQIGQNASSGYNFYIAATSTNINKRARKNLSGTETSWTHIAGDMKLSSSNAVLEEDGDVYIDGDESATVNDSGTNFGSGTNTNSICFGERNDGVGDFFGGIAYVRFGKSRKSKDWLQLTNENLKTASWMTNDGWASVGGSPNINITTSVTGSGALTVSEAINKLLNPSTSGSGTLTNVLNVLKSIANVITGNGLLSSSLNPNKPTSTTSTGSGDLIASTDINKQLITLVQANGNLTSQEEKDSLIQILGTAGGGINEELLKGISEDLVVSGNGNATTVLSILKDLSPIVQAGGNVVSVLSTQRLVDAYISGNGNLNATVFKDILASDAYINAILSGGGSVGSVISINKQLSGAISGSGDYATNIAIDKSVAVGISQPGDLVLNILKELNVDLSLSASGTLLPNISPNKENIITISASGDVNTTPSIDKQVISLSSANTAGILTATYKGTGIVASISTSGELSLNLIAARAIESLTITGNGNVNTVSIKDLGDISNIIYIDLETVAETNVPILNTVATDLTIQVKVASNEKEIDTYAST